MHETLIIGGGPAGLMAACYLGRFHRPSIVLDYGESRMRWIPTSHNTPGFPAGVSGKELLKRLREQALRYGTQIRTAKVEELKRDGQGFAVVTTEETFYTQFAILATGVKDTLPISPDTETAIHHAQLKICPICDGFESSGKRIAVIGAGEHAFREATFLQSYSDNICLINVADHTESFREQTESAGVQYICASLKNIAFDERSVRVLDVSLEAHSFDVAYSALGCHPQNHLAAGLGAQCDENGALRVDAHQQTTVSNLYAAGDVVRGLNQIVVAEAEAAVAATDIHNRLRSSK